MPTMKDVQKHFYDAEAGASDAYFGGGPAPEAGSKGYLEGYAKGKALREKHKSKEQNINLSLKKAMDHLHKQHSGE